MRKFQFSLRTLVIAVVLLGFLGSGLSWCAWYFDWGHDYVEKVPELNGLTMGAVEARLGPAPKGGEMKIKDCATSRALRFLLVYYPITEPGNADVTIRALQWEFHACFLTVWFHQVNGEWGVLGTCRWHKDVQF